MLRKYFVLSAIVILGSLSIASETENDSRCKWDFEKCESGKVPKRWFLAENHGAGTPARWEAIEMEGALNGKNVFALTKTDNPRPTFNLAIYKEKKIKDVKIQVKVKAMRGKIDQGGGPMWRVQDPDNYYIARWNPLEDNFRVYSVKDGKRIMLKSAEVKADPAKWHEIGIVMKGTSIEASFDGKKMIEVEDETFSDAGMTGLWTKADAATAFDDFVIESIQSNGS